MVKGIGFKDSMLLYISDHKLLSRICAYVQYIRIRLGLNPSLSDRIQQTLDVFLGRDERTRGGIADGLFWICFTAVIAT